MSSQRESVAEQYDWLRLCHAATRNVIAAFPEEKLDWRPAEGARSPREIVEHIYGAGAAHSAAVLKGELAKADYDAAEDAPKQGPAAELIAWADAKFAALDRDARAATEEQLAAPVKTFYGEFSGRQMLGFNYDEHWHHRGQLTVYLRLLGVPVPFVYEFADATGSPYAG